VLSYYRKRRDESEMVHALPSSLWGCHTPYPLYQESPEAALELVRKIQARLSDAFESLPNESKAFWPIREMHEAYLGFSSQMDPLTQTGSCGETELLLDTRAGGVYQWVLEDAVVRLRETVNSLMDELYEERSIEKLSSSKNPKKGRKQRQPLGANL
jgi:hypothetical protein